MPLVLMDKEQELGTEGRQPVLVFADRNRTMGLVVKEIVDIVDDRMNIELSSDRDGYIGTAVIDDKATDVIDASYYLTQAFHDWFAAERTTTDEEASAAVCCWWMTAPSSATCCSLCCRFRATRSSASNRPMPPSNSVRPARISTSSFPTSRCRA